jgi:hypothetical protein
MADAKPTIVFGLHNAPQDSAHRQNILKLNIDRYADISISTEEARIWIDNLLRRTKT